MEKEFVSYEIALELKELGFDEPCFGYYRPNGNLEYVESHIVKDFSYLAKNSEWQDLVAAPLYQQAFTWFREKYDKDSFIARCNSTKEYFFDISWRNKKGLLKDFQSKDFKTYEEAELECLKKLIEIVKENK